MCIGVHVLPATFPNQPRAKPLNEINKSFPGKGDWGRGGGGGFSVELAVSRKRAKTFSRLVVKIEIFKPLGCLTRLLRISSLCPNIMLFSDTLPFQIMLHSSSYTSLTKKC